MRLTFSTRLAAALTAAAAATACQDQPLPTGGTTAQTSLTPPEGPPGQIARQEQLARRLAVVLGQADHRRALADRLGQAAGPEGKLHFQALLSRDVSRLRHAMAAASASGAAGLDAELQGMPALEVYLPVPAHRAQWQGGDDLLVATALRDGDSPIGFDLRGRRVTLDPTRPPARPVLALVVAEQPFGENGEASCGAACGIAATTAVGAGLHMTYAAFTSTYEGWLKGNPEFETHLLGQDGGSSSLKPYQCAGEHAGGSYTYDQNAKTWTGDVLLFSQAQLDGYQAAHPNQALRVLVVEDDDTACVLKTETGILTNLFKAVDAAYKLWTGGKDGFTLVKVFQKATALQQAFSSAASVIRTNDEVVGTAIEDVVVGQTWPGANWIVKSTSNITTGGIRLEMR